MALLDRNGVYGAPRFHMEGQKLRCAGAHRRGGCRERSGRTFTACAYLPHQHPIEPVRLPLLAESRIGYQNLCRLITRYKLRERKKAEGAALTTTSRSSTMG